MKFKIGEESSLLFLILSSFSFYFAALFLVSVGLFKVIPFGAASPETGMVLSKLLHALLLGAFAVGALLLGTGIKKFLDKPPFWLTLFISAVFLASILFTPFLFIYLGFTLLLWIWQGKISNAVQCFFQQNIGQIIFSILVGILALLILWVACARWTPYPFSPIEDSTRLGALSQILLGAKPYRDVFINFGLLGDVVRPLLAFKIWGVNYGADQWMRGWIGGVGTVFVFLIIFELGASRLLVLLSGGILFFRSNFFIPDRATFCLVAVYCLVRAFKSQETGARTSSVYLGTLGGFIASAALLYSFDTGVTFFLGLILFSLIHVFRSGPREAWTDVKPMMFGISTGLLIFFIYLFWIGGFPGFIQGLNELFFHRLVVWGTVFPTGIFHFYWAEGHDRLLVFLVRYFPLMIGGLLLMFSGFQSKEGTYSASSLSSTLLASVVFCQYLIFMGRPDAIHRENAFALYWPALVVCMNEILLRMGKTGLKWNLLLANRLVGSFFLLLSFYALMGATSLSVFLFSNFLPSPHWIRNIKDQCGSMSSTPPRLGLLCVEPQERHRLEQLIKSVQANVSPKGTFYDLTNFSPNYFFVERKNPTRYPLVLFVHGPQMIKTCLSGLQNNPPEAVLVDWDQSGLVCPEYIGEICSYVRSRYKLKEKWERTALLTRNGDEK